MIGAGLALYLVLWLLFAVSYGVVFVVASSINAWRISRGRPARWMLPSYRHLALDLWARRIVRSADAISRAFSKVT